MVEQQKVIGINALFLIPNQVGGTEYHLRSFVKYLQKLDRKNKYVLFCNNENFETFTLTSKNWRKLRCPINASNRIARILYEQLLFPFIVKKSGCTMLHSYGYFGPLLTLGVPSMVTVHDVNWKDHPEDTGKLANMLSGFLTEASMRFSKQIITDSDFSKERILHYFPQYTNKLSVILPGVDDDFSQLLGQKTTSPIPHDYFLCVSACYPHKQIPKLLWWWQRAQRHYPGKYLVLIGQNGSDERKVAQLSSVISNVIRYKKVSYTELTAFYKHADAFLFPSTYEGFGYPVYEAVAAKVPVYVPSEEMYSSQIQKSINRESFSLNKPLQLDQPKIIPSNVVRSLSYEVGVAEILKLYDKQ